MDDEALDVIWRDPPRIAQFVAERYGFGPVAAIRPLRLYTNAVHELRAGDARYAVKVYRPGWRSAPAIQWEVDLLDHLAGCGIRVAPAIRARDGTSVHAIGDATDAPLVVVFAWAEGTKPDPPFPPELYEREGRAVAALHSVLDRFRSRHDRPALDLTALIDQPLANIVPLIASETQRRDLLATAHQLRSRITELASHGLDWGPCHGDLTFDNLHLTDTRDFVWYDFDSGGPGWRALDLQGWSAFDPAWRPLSDAFLAGYRAVRPLSAADIAAAPLLTLAQDIWGLSVDLRYRIESQGTSAVRAHLATAIDNLTSQLEGIA
jgi:Ser/Thr protein kinase RdoA (MazF antagonist)